MKISKIFKSSLKFIYKVCIIAGGGIAIYNNPVSGGIAGGVAIASAISSAIKDKNLKKILPLADIIVNGLACNIDKAKNDLKENS